ncbi:MAG: hypothetical protein MMC23_005762 [Stictis urceolatum]|nr:hypothetical protein [Stictis urceolata]
MSSYSSSNAAFGSQMTLDTDDETRLAQLQRIQELQSKIESQQPWVHQTTNIKTVPSSGYGNLAQTLSLSSNASFTDLTPSFGIEDGFQSPPSIVLSGSNHPLTSVAIADASVWDVNNGGHMHHGLDSMELDQEHFQGSSITTEQTMGSALSKSSEQSTNTSTNTPDNPIKIEEDENFLHLPEASSSLSALSTSSALSELNPTVPLISGSASPSSPKRRRISKETRLKVSDFKPRTAIPANIPLSELARQSEEAAQASRLNPFALHSDEYKLLRDHICHLHVTAYLNIRNRILRLWIRNPLVTVTPEEAAGCAYGSRWLGLAEVGYEWLVRRGYINFGCVEVPDFLNGKSKRSRVSGKQIVIVGAGMAGLGCARQLEGLFSHYRDKWTIVGEELPKVVLLEGRSRIGGRIYSVPLKNQASKRIPRNARCTAEAGAHIITGFDKGNPLKMIIRGQLALHYYTLRDNSTLFDVDGRIVNKERDTLVEKLFNDILDRAGLFRHKVTAPTTVEGDRPLIEAGKDPVGDAGKPISVVEEEKENVINKPENLSDKGLEQVPAGVDKLTGKAHMEAGSREKVPAAIAAEAMGWTLKSSDVAGKDLDLNTYANSYTYPTLGGAMDEGVKQYQSLLDLRPQDLRLMNWHYANLEYANATNLSQLSLGGWDQDVGNEFEGQHAQVIGGYIQVPRGIFQSPSPLNLKTKKTVDHIAYSSNASSGTSAKVTCTDGESIDASHVVITAPLGVLKDKAITFEPELPQWKQDSIDRLGFGTLNKVVLVFDQAFWDVEQDMIGLLRDSDYEDSYLQDEYSTNRGRFYLFWNCVKTSGRPLLIALMAGDAAHQAEDSLTDAQIVAEVTQQLTKMYRHKRVPHPQETVVTRWGKDRFARGTYSYVAPTAHSDDYDSMAKPIGNLHFAGEATCGTHPATVHGAYISGLRAASDIIDNLIGPIPIPQPLVPAVIKTEPKPIKPASTSTTRGPPIDLTKEESNQTGESSADKQSRLQVLENNILKIIFEKLGPRPFKPDKAGANPFLLYSKDKWGECKAKCDDARRAATGQPATKASRNEIRAALGLMWREASEEVKRPYIERTVSNRASNAENAKGFQDRIAAWDQEAIGIRRKYIEEHPGCMTAQEETDMWHALGVFEGAEKRPKKEGGYKE